MLYTVGLKLVVEEKLIDEVCVGGTVSVGVGVNVSLIDAECVGGIVGVDEPVFMSEAEKVFDSVWESEGEVVSVGEEVAEL